MSNNVMLPPQSLQAEQSVIGALMIDNSAWFKVQALLSERDFYLKANKIMFRTLMEMFSNQHPVDVLTVSDQLEKKGFLQDVGGLGWLVTLAKDTPSSANVVAYAELVRDKSLLRQLMTVSRVIAEDALKPDAVPKDLIAKAENTIFSLSQQRLGNHQGSVHLRDALKDVIETMEENYDKPKSGVLGLSTGFTDLDIKTSGFQAGNLIIVAARPSMGKTAFSVNIAEHVAINEQVPVMIFSMEMSVNELGQRVLSNQSNVDLKSIKESWTLKDDSWPLFSGALVKCNSSEMYIDDTPALTIEDIRSRCMRLQSELGDKKLGLIVVDYIQLMSSSNNDENRNNQIEVITRGLKRLAKDFNIPVVALSQLNRKLESRPNKRPIMSDLRESGGIEQDADIILFLYRDDVYNSDCMRPGMAEVIISKQRNGALGTVDLLFEGEKTRFRNFSYQHEDYA